MALKLKQNLTIFNRLNTKIVIYFLSFAFLPLLVFSILGYYLNKDLITRINSNQLKSLNSTYAVELKLFTKYKKGIINHALNDFRTSIKTKSLQEFLNTHNIIKLNFSKIQVISSIGAAATADQLRTALVSNEQPAVYYFSGEDWIIGFLNQNELTDLLKSNVKEIQNIAYFRISEKKVNDQSIESFESNEIKSIVNRADTESESVKTVRVDTLGFLYSYAFIDDANILLITKIETQKFYNELNAFRNKILIANIVFALILVMLAIFYSRRITTPIHRLIKAAKQIGRGDLNRQIDINTNDEIQILASEFELMRQKLQESYQSMENKIEKRTAELQHAQAQISHQEKMASLGMMAAGIAHEIGNPLTSISSIAQVIKRKNTDVQISEYLSNILKNIERISRIVRELVDFSRPSSYESAPADINEIIQSAVGIIKYDRRSKNLLYNLTLDPTLPKTILVSDHLLQVFLNILINAVDACDGYGNKISVQSHSNNGSIYVEIADTGSGIPSDMQNKIFEPFFTTKGVGKGTGLGLTVSYGLIKQLKGEIKVKSSVGKGSTFTVRIPIKSEVED